MIINNFLYEIKDLAKVAISGKYDDLENKPNLHTVATSGKLSDCTDDENHRLVTDTDISNWDGKVDKDGNKVLSTNDYTDIDKSKLDSIEMVRVKGSGSGVRYYPLAKFVKAIPDDTNKSSIIIAGRVGGYGDSSMVYIQAMLTNRNSAYGNLMNVGKQGTGLSRCKIRIYKDMEIVGEGTGTYVYLVTESTFTFDLDIHAIEAKILFDGTYSATAPDGNIGWDSSTSDNSLSLYDGQLQINKSIKIGSGVTMQYNSVNKSLDFVF